jgi:hypothetical protein
MQLILIIDKSKGSILKNTARLYVNSQRCSQAITHLRANHVQGRLQAVIKHVLNLVLLLSYAMNDLQYVSYRMSHSLPKPAFL